jgi:DNA repair photolyase
MKAVTLKEIKQELNTLSTQEIQDIVLRLSRFKKENKELLTYLLFESHNEDGYIENVKNYIDNEFELINTASYFYIKKSVRKILRNIKKFARYSLKKETEVALLLYFCQKLNQFTPSIKYNTTLTNIYNSQLQMAKKTISTLHEDLQHDYNLVLEEL